MKNKILIIAIFLCAFRELVFAQDFTAYQKHLFIQGTDSLPYRLLLPLNYDAKKNYPLILFLHGAGERGNDNEKQLLHGGGLFLTDSIRKNYPAIVVFPQCAANDFWSNIVVRNDSVAQKKIFEFPANLPPKTDLKLVMLLLDDLEKTYKVNTKKMYVGGLSMGGMGTYELVRNRPGKFVAAFCNMRWSRPCDRKTNK